MQGRYWCCPPNFSLARQWPSQYFHSRIATVLERFQLRWFGHVKRMLRKDWRGKSCNYTNGKAARMSTKERVEWLHRRRCLVPQAYSTGMQSHPQRWKLSIIRAKILNIRANYTATFTFKWGSVYVAIVHVRG